jgi:hypothetical protein
MYNVRKWLNSEKSSSTGSIVACHEPKACYRKGEEFESLFLEISDCHSKARLHKSYHDTIPEFTEKMRGVRDVVSDFIIYLEGLRD